MSMNQPPRLTVELVPRSQWGANLASSLRGTRWDALRQVTLRRAGHRCEVCNRPGPLHAHEEWGYDDNTGSQRLVRLVALCTACHEVKHIGRAGVRGRGPVAERHLAEVNGWTAQQTRAYLHRVFAVWKQRSQRTWTLDLSLLAEYGVEPPTDVQLRAAAAVEESGRLGRLAPNSD
jgi:hypothetical protein